MITPEGMILSGAVGMVVAVGARILYDGIKAPTDGKIKNGKISDDTDKISRNQVHGLLSKQTDICMGHFKEIRDDMRHNDQRFTDIKEFVSDKIDQVQQGIYAKMDFKFDKLICLDHEKRITRIEK